LKKGRKGVGNGRLSTGLDPQCPQEYIDSVYIGTNLTDGRFIGQSPSFAWPSYYSLRLIKDENGIIIIITGGGRYHEANFSWWPPRSPSKVGRGTGRTKLTVCSFGPREVASQGSQAVRARVRSIGKMTVQKLLYHAFSSSGLAC
jgi:hypothetical protein